MSRKRAEEGCKSSAAGISAVGENDVGYMFVGNRGDDAPALPVADRHDGKI